LFVAAFSITNPTLETHPMTRIRTNSNQRRTELEILKQSHDYRVSVLMKGVGYFRDRLGLDLQVTSGKCASVCSCVDRMTLFLVSGARFEC
jgi:hypothetical protein